MLLSSIILNTSCAQQKISGLSYLDGHPISVETQEGKIVNIERLNKLPGRSANIYIAPGLIDNQVNGYAGVSFSLAGGKLDTEGIKKATSALWKEGVTTYLPTLTTNKQEVLLKNLSILAEAKENPDILGSIPGFHLEGPYISPEDGFTGAHPKMFIRKPDWKEFMALYEASGKNILTITLAPEVEGGLNFIKKCADMGIVFALGHHNAPSDVVDKAVDAGALISTHFGNGCANLINRHKNPFWPQLANDKLMVSIICDGFHLLPEEIKTFYKIKGVDKTVITSDVTSYAGLPPGEYQTIDGYTVELTPQGMIYYPAQDCLYGSASPITKGVGHMMEVTGCTLADAIQMASTNPAKLYGLSDRGTIEKGKRADLILFTLENSKVKIKKTYVEGHLVYASK